MAASCRGLLAKQLAQMNTAAELEVYVVANMIPD